MRCVRLLRGVVLWCCCVLLSGAVWCCDALEARGVLAKRLTRKVTGARCAWRWMHLAREALGARGVRRPRRLAREGARGVLARETLAAGGTWRGMCSAPDAFGARFAWRARHLARDALGEGEGEKYIEREETKDNAVESGRSLLALSDFLECQSAHAKSAEAPRRATANIQRQNAVCEKQGAGIC